MMARQIRETTQEEELRARFQMFDRDGNGLIDRSELKLVMQELGEKLSEEDIDEMIEEADTNNDGFIDYDEFARYMSAN